MSDSNKQDFFCHYATLTRQRFNQKRLHSFSDDENFLMEVIAATRQYLMAEEGYPAADDSPIFVVGFSAGGVMAHRMACQHSNLISAVVSVSGPISLKGSLEVIQLTDILVYKFFNYFLLFNNAEGF